MPTDPELIAAVERAVEADPDSLPLRVHAASLLLEAGRAADALAHCQVVLGRDPANVEALRLAGRAARDGGDDARAAGYDTLLSALEDGSSGGQEPGHAVPAQGPSGGEHPLGPDDLPDPDDPNPLSLADLGGEFEIEQPEVTLEDVGGMAEVKRRLDMAFLAPMRNPKMREYYGKSLRGGMLLYGPPGCGKTFIARALAGELRARFQLVGLSDVLDMWLGESERKLHEIFEVARRSAPCVLFLDEIDALGQKRSHLRHQAGRSVVNQLLAELDGAGDSNDGVFVLAATNHPWDVDVALRRPGRLDRTLLVLPPDGPARETVLGVHLRDRPTGKLDLGRIASKTEGFSGADLAFLCESAAEAAMEESIAKGEPRPIEQRDLDRAMKGAQASTTGWFQVAYNYAMFANEGGAYDDLLRYIREKKLL